MHDTVTETLTKLSFQLINNSSDCIPRNTSDLIFNYVENVINIAELCVMLLVTGVMSRVRSAHSSDMVMISVSRCLGSDWAQHSTWSTAVITLPHIIIIDTGPVTVASQHCARQCAAPNYYALLSRHFEGRRQLPSQTESVKFLMLNHDQWRPRWVGGAFIESFYHTICYPDI